MPICPASVETVLQTWLWAGTVVLAVTAAPVSCVAAMAAPVSRVAATASAATAAIDSTEPAETVFPVVRFAASALSETEFAVAVPHGPVVAAPAWLASVSSPSVSWRVALFARVRCSTAAGSSSAWGPDGCHLQPAYLIARGTGCPVAASRCEYSGPYSLATHYGVMFAASYCCWRTSLCFSMTAKSLSRSDSGNNVYASHADPMSAPCAVHSGSSDRRAGIDRSKHR